MTRSLFCLLAWMPAAATAYQPLITDDTGTQGSGGRQIELSYTRESEETPGTSGSIRSIQPVYTLGWTDTLDLYAGGAHKRFAPPAPDGPQHGAGNIVAGLKWRFHENEKSGFSVAIKPEIRLPVSGRAEERGLGNGRANAAAALLLTQETGFGAIHANLAVAGARFARQADRDLHRDWLWRLSAAPVFELNERWRIAIDAGIMTNPHRTERARMAYLEAGTVHSLNRNTDLAAGYIREAGHRGHRVRQVTAGITWRFR